MQIDERYEGLMKGHVSVLRDCSAMHSGTARLWGSSCHTVSGSTLKNSLGHREELMSEEDSATGVCHRLERHRIFDVSMTSVIVPAMFMSSSGCCDEESTVLSVRCRRTVIPIPSPRCSVRRSGVASLEYSSRLHRGLQSLSESIAAAAGYSSGVVASATVQHDCA